MSESNPPNGRWVRAKVTVEGASSPNDGLEWTQYGVTTIYYVGETFEVLLPPSGKLGTRNGELS